MTILECHRVLAAAIQTLPNGDGYDALEDKVNELLVRYWMAAFARPQAGVIVKREPRAAFVGTVDGTLGASAPFGHLFRQNGIPVTTVPSTRKWWDSRPRTIVLTVAFLPAREADWPPAWPGLGQARLTLCLNALCSMTPAGRGLRG